MRLFFLNNQQHNTNEKSNSSFKKTVYNLISRNNTSSQATTSAIEPKPAESTPSQQITPKPITYQHVHWKELCTAVTEQHTSKIPEHFLTHSHIRSTRSNPNQLILIAASNRSNTPVTFCKVLKKRSDDFVWGRQSRLRNEL